MKVTPSTLSQWYSCDPKAGGNPLCKLGFSAAKIQLPGASGTECIAKKRQQPDWWGHKCDVMVVGEAPGYEEDRLHIPFVGRSGDKLFDKFLRPAGFDFDKVYVTNAVKCGPPKLRKPAPEEIKACRIHIEHEIRHFKPKVILLAGNTALRVFNLHNKGSISYIHGKLFNVTLPGWDDGPVFKVIPVFHPAYFLRKNNPRLERRILQDFHFAKRVLDEKEVAYKYYIPDYKVIQTMDELEWLVDQLNNSKEFAYDTESVGLPWNLSPLTNVSVCWGFPGKVAVVPFSKHDPNGVDYKTAPYWTAEDDPLGAAYRLKVIEMLRVPFQNPAIAKMAHNKKYDDNVIRKWLGILIQGFGWDTCTMHHILEEIGPHGLEYLADMEFGVGDYSAPVRAIVGQGNRLIQTFDYVPDDIIWPYTCTDVECTYRLKEVYLPRLQQKSWLLNLYMEESGPISTVLREAEWLGHQIDIPVLEELIKEYEEKEEESLSKIYGVAGEDFNPRSSKDVVAKLQSMGFSSYMRDENKTRGFRADREILELISDKCELAKLLLEYRSIRKIRTTYLANIYKDVDVDERIRYSWWIHGTESGRLSCRLLHQTPRSSTSRTAAGKKNIRDIFIAKDGFDYFYADYDQIELRCLGLIANDLVLLKALRDGQDIHKLTAAAALGIPFDQITEEQRQIGKGINFGTSFGSKGYTLAKNLKISLSRVQGYIKKYLNKFKGVAQHLKDVPIAAMSAGGTVRSVFGRERRIEGLGDPDLKVRSHAEREAVNFTIQNPAAAITIRTAILVDEMLKQNNIGKEDIRMVQHVHDSISYEVRKKYLAWFQQAFRIIAERPIPQLKMYSFPVSCGVGRSWAEAERDSKK